MQNDRENDNDRSQQKNRESALIDSFVVRFAPKLLAASGGVALMLLGWVFHRFDNDHDVVVHLSSHSKTTTKRVIQNTEHIERNRTRAESLTRELSRIKKELAVLRAINRERRNNGQH